MKNKYSSLHSEIEYRGFEDTFINMYNRFSRDCNDTKLDKLATNYQKAYSKLIDYIEESIGYPLDENPYTDKYEHEVKQALMEKTITDMQIVATYILEYGQLDTLFVHEEITFDDDSSEAPVIYDKTFHQLKNQFICSYEKLSKYITKKCEFNR